MRLPKRKLSKDEKLYKKWYKTAKFEMYDKRGHLVMQSSPSNKYKNKNDPSNHEYYWCVDCGTCIGIATPYMKKKIKKYSMCNDCKIESEFTISKTILFGKSIKNIIYNSKIYKFIDKNKKRNVSLFVLYNTLHTMRLVADNIIILIIRKHYQDIMYHVLKKKTRAHLGIINRPDVTFRLSTCNYVLTIDELLCLLASYKISLSNKQTMLFCEFDERIIVSGSHIGVKKYFKNMYTFNHFIDDRYRKPR
ncbi:MAG: hypothetical protein JRL30_20345 [Deltaproteobacteria bacterium]|nr:hypothetical protein [Deltaproteobacteria bacterium]